MPCVPAAPAWGWGAAHAARAQYRAAAAYYGGYGAYGVAPAPAWRRWW